MENRFVWILFCTIWLIRLPAFSQQGSSGERMFFYHHDHLGNTVCVTDESGEVVQHVEYLPTGEVFVEEKNPASTYATSYKFNGKELDEETGLYYYGARYLHPKYAMWLSTDPLERKYPNVSSYCYAYNNSIKFIDINGCELGDYYSMNGKYLGTDGKNDNKVYVADGINNGTFINPRELGINHSEFAIISNIIKHEGDTDDSREYLWIAHATNNEAKRTKSTILKKLSSSFSSVSKEDKSVLSPSAKDARSLYARAAVINVLCDNPDPTGGAVRWDGTDFIAWGLKSPNGKPHNKFSEYKFIQINQYILSSYEKAQISKYKNGVVTYYGHKYSIPASVFTNSSNLDPHRGFYYKTGNKEQYGIEATGVAGRTIFWRLKL